MDQRTAAIIDGDTAVINDAVKLLVENRLPTKHEAEKAASDVVVKGLERGAQPGLDEVPILILRRMDEWTNPADNPRAQAETVL